MKTNFTKPHSFLNSATTLFIISLFLQAFATAAITKGPVLLRVNQDRAAVMFETDTPGPGKIICNGPWFFSKKYTTTPDTITHEPKSDDPPADTVYIHKTWLDGLEPNRSYRYRVIEPEKDSAEHSFRTTPAKTKNFRFVVYGDTRSRPERHRRIVEQIIKTKPDFVVVSGDLVYDGRDYSQWSPQFFGPIKGLAESTPIYAVKGNHDRGRQNYFERLLLPTGQNNNYSFRFGPLYFYCLDNFSGERQQLLKLLTDNLVASDKKWKFTAYHIPSINLGGHQSAWGYPHALPALSAAGADFVTTGDSHIYERFYPIAPAEDTDGSFVTYITSGGGGAPNYNIIADPIIAKESRTLHFCLFEIDGDKLSLKVIDDTGQIIDSLKITKTDGKLNEEYTATALSLPQAQARIAAYMEENKKKK
jgi:predicted phosphodiesterase